MKYIIYFNIDENRVLGQSQRLFHLFLKDFIHFLSKIRNSETLLECAKELSFFPSPHALYRLCKAYLTLRIIHETTILTLTKGLLLGLLVLKLIMFSHCLEEVNAQQCPGWRLTLSISCLFQPTTSLSSFNLCSTNIQLA